MTLTFSDKKEIDYEHLNLNSLTIQFDPLYKGNGIVNQYNNFQNCATVFRKHPVTFS